MAKSTITIEGSIFDYKVKIEYIKEHLKEKFIMDSNIRLAYGRPLISIRQYIKLECIAFAFKQIDEQRKGFELTFL